jgi:hypothetical protein
LVSATSIPLGDGAAFERRATAVRRLRAAFAAVGLAAVIAFLVGSFRQPTETVALLPASSSGVVVLDVSASISSDTYARIAATLDRLIRSRGSYGLILFSDTAYQALPPNTPARELTPLLRFFDVPKEASPGALPQAPRSPWTDAFGAGTRISTGLSLALDVIRKERLSRPAVLLVSDLDDDSGDVDRVSQTAIAYRRAGIPLHVVGLNAAPEDVAFIRRFVTGTGSFEQAALPSKGGSSSSAGIDRGQVALAVLAALALAGFLLLAEPLRWRAT